MPSDTSSGGSGSPCTKVNNEQECLGHPECAWCRNKKGMGIDSCLHRNSNPKVYFSYKLSSAQVVIVAAKK